jgi:NAD(P)-dependent dehydrogenase (short-subunit alcohol dehydrogenase family)
MVDLPSSQGEAEAAALGPNVTFSPADVTSEEQITAALDILRTKYGGDVNVAVNCAGIGTLGRVAHPKKGPHPLDLFIKTIMVPLV